ncbi:glycosylphosphatidylinositol anchor biosynthesis [Coemansia thaxteri]|nr:glycosylphosphatidylinositol anchor biosynthesis [Coemansia thaxteri]
MLLVDRLGYQRWVFPPYQFYLFNVHEGQASWFGKSPPLYHLYVSLPLLFTSMLPFVCHGVYVAYSRGCVTVEPALVSLAAMFVFSLVDHMEYRFLYPLLPVGFLYAAVSINSLAGALPCIGDLRRVASGNNPGSTEEDTNGAEPTVSERAKALLKAGRLWSARKIILYLLITNVPPTLYLNLVHQRGSVDVMEYLRSEAQSRRIDDVGFLMPCHSTPFYSHLHQPIPMWFLSCEPPLERALLSTHYWEANEFELNPIGFLHKIFQPATGQPAGGVVSSANDIRAVNRIYQPGQARPKPSHLVLYGCMAARIHLELAALGYRECARFFNTHFSIDSRRRGDVVVYRRSMAATSS